MPLTPKMFELLLVLLENQGKILNKEFLLKAVWPDSFVEEGNISFNIRQLRKALDDSAQSPTYIETVARRGYRFLAEVEKVAVAPEPETAAAAENLSAEQSKPKISFFAKFRSSLVVAVVLFAFVTAIGSWFLLTGRTEAAPVLSEPFASEKLSTNGMVYGAAISPDGRTVVYSNRSGGKQSVWLRQLDSGNNVELIPSSEDNYYEFVYSPDGNSIYFSRKKRDTQRQIDIFRISIFGGIPEKVLTGTEGSVSLSPDGETISFVRCPLTEEEWCSLFIADVKTGKNERKLASRPYPIRIADNEISPEGTRIAFAVGHSRNQANEFGVAEVDLATGAEKAITDERFFNIKNLSWLPDGTGLLLTASRMPNKYFRIWHLPLATGIAEALTKDSEAYSVLSLSGDARRLVSTQIKQDFQLNVFDMEGKKEKLFLADASRASFAPDGMIYFTSVLSGNDEIWRINADGSGQRQLTNDPAGDGHPIVSHDNRTVFFTSNRSGAAHVWRMDPDGTNQTQVTTKEGGSPAFLSPDGKTLYYGNAIYGTLWSVSLESGEEKLVFNKAKRLFVFSPDGSSFGVEERNGDGLAIQIVSLTSGETLATLQLPKERSRLLEFAWMPDGGSLLYLMSDADFKMGMVYHQSLGGGAAREIADLRDNEISEVSGISVSPDGKSFTVVLGGWRHDAVLITGLK